MSTTTTDKAEGKAQAALHELARRVERVERIPPRLLDIHDSARYLGTSDKTIRQLIACGEVPYVQRIAGRSPYLLDRADLDQWVEAHKQRAGF